MKILVTGGAGYIGSHTVLELLVSGHDVVVLDNLCNSSIESLKRVEQLADKGITFYKADIRDSAALKEVFSSHNIDAVIHFAGLKAVGESVNKPLDYYSVNVSGSVALTQAMAAAGVTKLIFSSSATVYGEDATVPYKENMPRGKTSNPYGTSKAMVEQVLTDITVAYSDWSVVLLRYFNPVGAHLSGSIGEDPQGIPNNLMPFIAQVAVGRRECLSIFGNDYDTEDGTCERDYLHVVDLAKGHVSALQATEQAGAHIYNLGTGTGTSVKQMVEAFERVTEVTIPYKIAPRRLGDLAAFWADASKAEQELSWRAELDIDDMMRDTWRWQQNNPQGYKK
ncbi:UDP-glucose 4-epimerase GalE [Idiomarina ramblicola]|uniref:UDP-glucose 4-epimerase n=1 Tax=Idiomarina ramblicola TaxID=263724 RepID=A0A432Z1J2_9GAMM|nr:UDP-glucose 4-epimerase GalE [Idiomarina ramblicola]RUO71735.1 UDP-glucose 4-epimerase GalE [Idiomarina ramblicola]